jgi:hypothetical protein
MRITSLVSILSVAVILRSVGLVIITTHRETGF